MYDTLIVKNITDLALAMKDLYDDNRELQVKIDNYRAETKRLNEKIKEINTELNERDKLIEEIRTNIEARLEECI